MKASTGEISRQMLRSFIRNTWRHPVCTIALILCASVTLIFVHNPVLTTETPQSRLFTQSPALLNKLSIISGHGNSTAASQRIFTILYWNTFFDRRDFYVGYGDTPFYGCSYTNCRTTDNKAQLRNADALLFHLLNQWDEVPIRLERQLYIFFLKESPALSFANYRRYDQFFNATMTYRLDSDIVNGYFSVLSGPETVPLPPIENRSRPVAWIVSNCVTTSAREDYVDLLREHIDVYIFGKCGNSKCPQGERNRCYEETAKHFYFYLSFENSRCQDYITEKFSLALKYGMVPVVMGPDKATYEKLAPPHSFIHIDDYQSPEMLARYLHYLMSNTSAYGEYHQWRKSQHIGASSGWCNICRYLNQNRTQKVINSLHDWWLSSCRYAPVITETSSATASTDDSSQSASDSSPLKDSMN